MSNEVNQLPYEVSREMNLKCIINITYYLAQESNPKNKTIKNHILNMEEDLKFFTAIM